MSVTTLASDDLTAAGWRVKATSGLDDLVVPQVRGVDLPGLGRTIEPSTWTQVAPREATVTLLCRATTASALQTALQRLRYRVGRGSLTLTHLRRPNQQLTVRLVRGPASYGPGPEAVGPYYVEVALVVRAADPYWVATTDTVVTFTAASPTACPIGDASVRPVLLLAASGGAVVNPTITYTDAAAATVWSLAITHTIASGDAWEIDARTGTVRKRVSGVWSDASSTLVAGYGLPVIRPEDGDFLGTGSAGSLAVSASSGAANATGTATYAQRFG